MTSISENKRTIVGLSIVLRPTNAFLAATPLTEWLSSSELQPIWIALAMKKGVVKAMPILLNYLEYPLLLQCIFQQISEKSLLEWQGQYYELIGVEIETNELFVIHLTITNQDKLPATIGRAIHALFLQWIAKANPNLAEELHKQDYSSFTLSNYPTSPQKTCIKITLLQPELLSPLLWGLSADLGKEVTIANISCFLSNQVDIFSTNTYQKLASIPTEKQLLLEFRSPTSFKQKLGIQSFLLPDLVFGSLQRKWNIFAPAELQFPVIEWQGLVSAFDLKTHALKLEGGAEIGAQGWVRYYFSDEEQAKFATILSHFACFSGVGRKTTMGMGQVKLKFRSSS